MSSSGQFDTGEMKRALGNVSVTKPKWWLHLFAAIVVETDETMPLYLHCLKPNTCASNYIAAKSGDTEREKVINHSIR